MMRLRFALCLMVACWLAGSAFAVQVHDDRGVAVEFVQPPKRVVSLLPSLTESVCALGQCHRLVGVDRYSNHPPRVTKLPLLGGGMDPSIEGIVALKPDVVLLAGSARIASRLESLGIKVLALEPKRHADVHAVLQTLGQLFGVPDDAERVWRAIQIAIQTAAQTVPPQARGQRVYFEVGRGPYAASEASFMGETLARLGMRNVVPAGLGAFPQLNPEFVVQANPDLIMVGQSGLQAVLTYPGWSNLRAVRDRRMCVFAPDESDVLVRPGPRMAEAAQIMARCLQEISQ
jgi:iron complex transport system substrate-binding protein